MQTFSRTVGNSCLCRVLTGKCDHYQSAKGEFTKCEILCMSISDLLTDIHIL